MSCSIHSTVSPASPRWCHDPDSTPPASTACLPRTENTGNESYRGANPKHQSPASRWHPWPNAAMPWPDEKTVTGRELDLFDNLVREQEVWMQRLKHVFSIEIETCPKCGGTPRVIACIEDPDLIATILEHIRARDEAEPPQPRAPPPGIPTPQARTGSSRERPPEALL